MVARDRIEQPKDFDVTSDKPTSVNLSLCRYVHRQGITCRLGFVSSNSFFP